jgi:hypothetical protein
MNYPNTLEEAMQMVLQTSFWAAWLGIIGGFLSGAGLGLFFYKEQWLGGYGSWQRRMLRLAHISFFGIALINLLYFIGSPAIGIHNSAIQIAFIIAAISMPLVCCLSAIQKNFRHLFCIPVLSLFFGALLFLLKGGIL